MSNPWEEISLNDYENHMSLDSKNYFSEIFTMKKVVTCLLIIMNVCACVCLAYFGYIFVSGSTIVDYPEAMLPMERWDRGGWALTIGTVPLIIANVLGYFFIQLGNKKSRLIIFIPSIICIGLVACYWIKSLA